ncbi:MAG: hypothetical protein RL660_1141 [Bacteroidota bacterium]
MKRIIFPALIATLVAISAFTVASNGSLWNVKEDAYSVKFTTAKFEGAFKGLKSELLFDENNLAASKLIATIDATTINTGNGMRNGHAKQGLDVKKFQSVKFVSTSITKTSSGYEATGNLTVKDVTKQIRIPFTFTQAAGGGVFAGTFSLKPADYNVKKAGTPDVFNFQLNVPVTR